MWLRLFMTVYVYSIICRPILCENVYDNGDATEADSNDDSIDDSDSEYDDDETDDSDSELDSTDSDDSDSEYSEIDDEDKKPAQGIITKNTTIKPKTNAKTIRNSPNGPFYEFLVNVCDALLSSTFKRRLLPKYFQILATNLKYINFGRKSKHIHKSLKKKLKHYSTRKRYVILEQVEYFKKVITSGNPAIDRFMVSMNNIMPFTIDQKLDDYIFALKHHGRGEDISISSKTEYLFKNVIQYTFNKQKYDIQDDIKENLQDAWNEYDSVYEDDDTPFQFGDHIQTNSY